MTEAKDQNLPSINPKEKKFLPAILHHVFNEVSRKVSFGWWLFIVATWLTFKNEIDEQNWIISIILSTVLIGGGTVADEVIKVGRAFIEAKFGGNKATPTPPTEPAK